MPDGRRGSERMIASPRKMCVPGVHAYASAGIRTSASNTASAIPPAGSARGEARVIGGRLDPDSLALPPNGFPKIVELVLHDVVDRIACGVHIVANLLDHFVDRNPIDQLFPPIDRRPEATLRARRCPTRSFSGATTSPAGPFESAASCPFRALEPRQSGECGASSRVPYERPDRSAP